MGRQGIHVFSRTLRYRNETIIQPDGRESTVMVGREKGIDVRLALDILLLGFRREYDVAVVFSQDQDLSEVADEIRILAKSQGRWIKIVSAFPMSPTSKNRRGINGTDWLKVDRETYTSCSDPRDYRPKTTNFNF
ncbi:MAG: NYN domain-containing protein [Spartobacteria bacterium]